MVAVIEAVRGNRTNDPLRSTSAFATWSRALAVLALAVSCAAPYRQRMRPDAFERAVLIDVLAEHPAPVHLQELVRVIGDERATLDALSALEEVGPVYRRAEIIVASRAAVRFDQLAV